MSSRPAWSTQSSKAANAVTQRNSALIKTKNQQTNNNNNKNIGKILSDSKALMAFVKAKSNYGLAKLGYSQDI